MRPGQLVSLLFGIMAVAAILLSVGAIYILTQGTPVTPSFARLVGASGLVLFLFVLFAAWGVLQIRLIRPIDVVTREMGILSHARKLRH